MKHCMDRHSMMPHGASACAGAASSCAYTASMQSAFNNHIALILDAMTVASIIICTLLALAVLGISLLVQATLVLLAVLLVFGRLEAPSTRRYA